MFVLSFKFSGMLFRTILFLSLLSFSTSYLAAQQHSEPVPDSAVHLYILKLLQQSQDSFPKNKEKSFEYASKAFSLAEETQDKAGLVRALIQMGLYHGSKKKFKRSIEFLFDALSIAEKYRLQEEKLFILEKIGFLYIEIKKYDRALALIDEAMALASDLRDYNQKAQLLLDQSKIFYETGRYKRAARNYFYILSFADSITERRVMMNTYRGLGTVFFYEKNDSWALYYFRLSVLECLQKGLYNDLGSIYTLMAHVYQRQNAPDSCLKYNILALKVRTDNNLNEHRASSMVNIGNLFLERGQPRRAYPYIREGISLLSGSEDYNLISYAYKQLYRLHLMENNYPEALHAFEQYHAAEDSLIVAESRGEIEQIEANYWITEIEQEKDLLLVENEIQRLSLENKSYSELLLQLIIGIFVILLIIVVYIYERNKLGKSKLESTNEQLSREIEERKLTEVQLRTSESLYRFVTDHTLDLIIRMDRNFRFLYVSPSVFQMFGYTPEETLTPPAISKVIPDRFWGGLKVRYLNMVRSREPVLLTHQSRRKDGSLFWSESLVNPIFDEKTGEIRETIIVIRDITERVAYEKALSDNARQKELLLREIHHRVKNNFAILISLMNMQKGSPGTGDFKEFLTELQGRIRTMSLVHELLYRSHDIGSINFGEYLSQLAGIISRAYKDKQVVLHTRAETCILDVETALPLGLISNEIITNAYKYAFSDLKVGELWMELQKYPETGGRECNFSHTLTFRDNGPGLPKGFLIENQATMGSQIIALLTEQLEAQLVVSGENGSTFTIRFSDRKRE